MAEAAPGGPGSSPVDQLRCDIVQAVACVRLMLGGWVERAADQGFNYSTLIQQIMSVIAERSGIAAADLYAVLCGRSGPFRMVDPERMVMVLRSMHDHDMVVQSDTGELLLGVSGERYVNHFTFYASFETPDEWTLVAGGRQLGSLPIAQPLYKGVLLVFGGRRWEVCEVETEKQIVAVRPATWGTAPTFGGGAAAPVSDRVRLEMRAVYEEETDDPTAASSASWLDGQASVLVGEGREAYRGLGLGDAGTVRASSGTWVFPWLGDKALYTATVLLSTPRDSDKPRRAARNLCS